MPQAHSYLASLNPRQRDAVLATDGPVLILAGAGAGKTKTLTHRIHHLIETGVDPSSILAITFTNKAAMELRERILHLVSENESSITPTNLPLAKTFHSLCVLILREQHELLGLPRFFTIFDRNDSISAIKKSLAGIPLGFDMKPTAIMGLISSWKSEGMTTEDARLKYDGNYRLMPIVTIWEEYDSILKKEKSLDFDDLILKTVELLESHSTVRDHYINRWSHIHVDEYQDTNSIQYRLSKLLIGPKQNICVVGDADQTIYMWRGANIQNILDFEKDFPSTATILLEQNYRSTKTILQAANDCIKKNVMRKEKNLFTDNDDGEPISLRSYVSELDEAEGIAGSISHLIENGVSPKDIGILYRANYQSRALEEAMMRHEIQYDLLGTKFFDRREVKDVLSYIRAAFNRSSTNDVTRAASFPRRGIGPSTIEKIVSGTMDTLSKGARDKAESFNLFLDQIKEKAEASTPREVLTFIIEGADIERELMKEGDEGEDRMQNIRELVSLAASYDDMPGIEGIEHLIENASLSAGIEDKSEQNGVRLMTVHASKGLEFDHVFITGLEDGLFPSRKETTSKAEAEEERRLFYVALTRARKKLHLSYALSRRIFGSQTYSPPSEFVTEIDPSLIDQEITLRSSAPKRGGYLDDIDF